MLVPSRHQERDWGLTIVDARTTLDINFGVQAKAEKEIHDEQEDRANDAVNLSAIVWRRKIWHHTCRRGQRGRVFVLSCLAPEERGGVEG